MLPFCALHPRQDRKSTRLNSSHSQISYAVFCLKKKERVSVMRAFYVLANAHRFAADSTVSEFDIIDAEHVGVTPALHFGRCAAGYTRFSFQCSAEPKAPKSTRAPS